MAKRVLEFALKAALLAAVLFAGIYHVEIKNIISGTPHEQEGKLPEKPKVSANGFGIYTNNVIPGADIIENRGFYCYSFSEHGNGEYFSSIRNAVAAIENEGAKIGANAFINFRMASATTEMQGSKWNSAYVTICGDFVKLK